MCILWKEENAKAMDLVMQMILRKTFTKRPFQL